jgi:hypothetical protein
MQTEPSSPSASNGASFVVVTRDEARKGRLVRYYTGEPCIHGHLAERLTRDGFCTQCKRIRRAAYTAERSAEENAKRAAYYQANRAAELARKARYNIEQRALRTATENMRRARKLQAVPPWFGELDELVMDEASDLAFLRWEQTGIDWHVDHMIPLQAKKASGLHVAANIQVIPQKLNSRKLNRMVLTQPGDWIRCT